MYLFTGPLCILHNAWCLGGGCTGENVMLNASDASGVVRG